MINRIIWWSIGPRMLLRACFVTLLFLPAIIALGLSVIPDEDRILWIVLVPFVHVAGDAISRLLSKWRRWITETLIVMIVLTSVYSVFGMTNAGAVTVLAYGFFMIQGTIRPSNGQLFDVHQAYYAISFFMYLIITFWYRNNTEHEGYVWLMNIAGILTLVLCLFVFNHINMNKESYSDSSSGAPVSRSIVRQNRLLVSIVAILVFLVASISWIGEMLNRVFGSLYEWLRRLLATSPDDNQPIEQPEQNMPDNLMSEPPADHGWFMQLLEKIFMFIGGALAVVLVLWLGYKLLRKLPIIAKLIEQWMQRLSRKERLAASDAGYEDEIEQVEHERGASRLRKWSSSLLRGRTEDMWDKLPDNAARIRDLYRNALLRRERHGYAPKPQLTPRETAVDLQHKKSLAAAELPKPLVELYERARYSASPIDSSEAQQARELEQQLTMKKK
ncbi:uncharacterized protein DUF4129 [Paenibacillus cellulosilyticus]|uniref:Uncharacterized protein DUF4129 n=1 Tax=Paenibacillus cellulosilyticus TaxID=375489 RepID=A0A2V2YU94_9BACL|nr:DUF4129 domain-containing protein [Paenibacillus cellulosilyticus]PWW00765.1 uncharacterized protein DUF4129 [Paenibacillus cellulosilyticus]QKS45620.1 DUF4129 domain-containing protein [Paenibacillus cellulosilyticus]